MSRLWSLTKADTEFSLYIRERDGWRCKRCGKQHEKGSGQLTCSHFWNRQHKGTRFDPDNNDAICWFPCHAYYWEKEKQGDYRNFKIRQLGLKKYKSMERRARAVYPQSQAIMDCMRLLGALE